MLTHVAKKRASVRCKKLAKGTFNSVCRKIGLYNEDRVVQRKVNFCFFSLFQVLKVFSSEVRKVWERDTVNVVRVKFKTVSKISFGRRFLFPTNLRETFVLCLKKKKKKKKKRSIIKN